MKNKHLVNNSRLGFCVMTVGLVMLGTGPLTFAAGQHLLYQHNKKENPDKGACVNSMSAMNTAGTVAACQMLLSIPVVIGGIAIYHKKEKQHE